MKKIFITVFFFIGMLNSYNLIAQDLLKGQNLSTLKVDNLSESDIAKINSQLQSNNTSVEQAELIAISKGMSPEEFAKLKSRLALQNVTSKGAVAASAAEVSLGQEVVKNVKEKDIANAVVFGSDLFDNPALSFEPNLKLATPMNYILGTGDELQISVFGVQEFNANVPVTNEGKISIQYVGQIAVAGMTIEAATQKIKSAISRIYSTVHSGQSKVEISLSRIRTIKITIIGSKQPGNYSVSSLATVFNALHLAGGPDLNGSYRNIELLRNDKVIRNIDIYNFLVNGNQKDNVGLKDNDVIRIPAYSLRVTLEGEVKRPGIFEMKPNETFTDLLKFASGFNEFAYRASVNVVQKTKKELKVMDIKDSDFSAYFPKSGDVFKVPKILDRYENRVNISGSVFRPNQYSFYKGMKIADLIRQADGLKEDAYKERARIIRLKQDLTKEIITINLQNVLDGNPEDNIDLKREDVVYIFSILDFKEEYKITIDGEIQNPGVFDYQDNLTLNDLIIASGGLTGSASKRVEIARMIKAENIDETNPNKVELFNIEITPDSNEQANNFELKPFDVVNIRRMAVNEKPEMVKVIGSVVYPGKYVLASKKEKIYDIIKRAGGLTSLASLNGVKIKRPIKKDQIDDLENVNLNLGKNNEEIEKKLKYATIPVDWNEVSKTQSSNANVTLLPGDEIEVSAFNETVKVVGNVLLNSEIPYAKGKGVSYYLDAVGGVDAKGWRKNAYIIYPNGQAAVSHKVLLFFRSNPTVVPGSQIVVPEKPETKKMSAGEWVSIASVLVSMGVLLVTALKP